MTRLDNIVRVPNPVTATIGFFGAVPGAGATVAARLAATVLAVRGSRRVLVANAAKPRSSALIDAGLPLPPELPAAPPVPGIPAASTTALDAERRRANATTFAEATVGLSHDSGGYHLDLAATGEAHWWQTIAPLSRFFDYTITDWGADPRTRPSIAAAGPTVCLVAAANRPAIQQAVDLADATHQAGATALICVSDVGRTWTDALGELCTLLPVPVVVIPHDRALRLALPYPHLAIRTRIAALRLAAALVTVTP
jgi:hypothetical protein